MIKVEKTLIITVPEEDRQMLKKILGIAIDEMHISNRTESNEEECKAIRDFAVRLLFACQGVVYP